MTDVDYKRPLPPRRSASNSRTVCLFMVVVEFCYWFARMMRVATCPFHLYPAMTVRRPYSDTFPVGARAIGDGGAVGPRASMMRCHKPCVRQRR